MRPFFVKSFEEDHCTKTIVGKEKKTFQTLENILATKTISFGQKKRLSTTLLSANYTKTYRPQGIIFQTKMKPDYVLPFDLVLLSNAENIVVHYYRIKNNLHVYYNHRLNDGYEKFIFKNIDLLIEKFKSPKIVWQELNNFRVQQGFPALPKSKYRLAEYNEAVFLKPVKIEPVALFGYRATTKKLAKKFGLKHFRTAREFYEKTK